jgi:hypothetical protein
MLKITVATGSSRDRAGWWTVVAIVVVQVLVSAAALPFPDCTSGPLSHLAVCDAGQPVTIRAVSKVAAMNLSEKASRLQNGSSAVTRLWLPAYQWWSEALHGIMGGHGVSFATEGPYRCATSFPEPLGLARSSIAPCGASWGQSLQRGPRLQQRRACGTRLVDAEDQHLPRSQLGPWPVDTR